MNAPEAEQQLVSGVYNLENDQWRWMARTAVILLKPPVDATPLIVRFYIPDSAPARRISVEIDNEVVATQTYAAPGTYTLVAPARKPAGDSVTASITVDKSFSTQSDSRQLGVVLTEVGFAYP